MDVEADQVYVDDSEEDSDDDAYEDSDDGIIINRGLLFDYKLKHDDVRVVNDNSYYNYSLIGSFAK